ncbi:uncharacterized protein VTP21DRAFT_9276 [Calcarisporiella thermophila]|uniref:uncharacterized protein n=1 Tax=Calcarisporiella thermophila TaxID=911321 RepID=UPI0037438767
MRLPVVVLVGFSLVAGTPLCLDDPFPLHPERRVIVPCPLSQNPPIRRQQFNTSQAFIFDFQCKVEPTLCDKAREGLRKSGEILSSYLEFSEPVRVNATFHRFCQDGETQLMDPGCEKRGYSIVVGEWFSGDLASPLVCAYQYEMTPHGDEYPGLARPTRLMLLEDDDQIVRFYPQPLVKQLTFSPRPAYATYDITAEFNAEHDWHFWADGPDLGAANRTDFEETVIHELIHGLGFLSMWVELPGAPSALVPPGFLLNAEDERIATVTTDYFIETALDRYLVSVEPPNTIRASEYAKQLNQAARAAFKQPPTLEELTLALETSPEFAPARAMMRQATANNTLALLPLGAQPDDFTWLETGLNPFRSGSSVSHVSLKDYRDTSERLMTYKSDRPLSLYQSIQQYGGPIGPRLQRCMASIGYKTRPSLPAPNPPRVPASLPPSKP